MSTIASTSLNNRNSLLRSSVIGGLIIGMLHLIVQAGIVFSLLGKTPFVSVYKYMASGAMGNAALTCKLDTAHAFVFGGMGKESFVRTPICESHSDRDHFGSSRSQRVNDQATQVNGRGTPESTSEINLPPRRNYQAGDYTDAHTSHPMPVTLDEFPVPRCLDRSGPGYGLHSGWWTGDVR